MLFSKNRLKKQSDFKKIIRKKIVFSEGFLILKKTENGLKDSRFAFIVSRKISTKAVVRNKIKRRLREIIRINLKKIKPGHDIVFFTKKGIEKEKSEKLEESVYFLLKKSGLLTKISLEKRVV